MSFLDVDTSAVDCGTSEQSRYSLPTSFAIGFCTQHGHQHVIQC